jgi:nitroimidazol reductase NimA-like FMN-containing flavoprotein (pyridoxamine 5'-phosphate oxidase superfamily)
LGKGSVLTQESIDALLRQPVIARLATVRPDGWPYIVPIWQYWDGQAMWIVPRAKSAFVPYPRSEPRVCVSVALDASPYTRVMLLGVAEIVEGPVDSQGGESRWVQIAREMSTKYLNEHAAEYLEPTMDRPRYLVKISPTKALTSEGNEWLDKYL